ncbi:HAMP domain-containing sensor histidine kinase [Nitrosomonas aestuarii]|uniref:HAMP domain-containing sensor histidine kinase n=1 Tax=Nitrosomonas aestuarii TaxID=52441 RepID=UPI000D32794B|nr:HAMP domain-containing sensor histidine kinase [Nitrosomonas aestuarii]PTN12436.1 signal transduction histidine kinase [Nitrosomonas aestuarii]
MQKTTNRIAQRITFAFFLYGILLTSIIGLSLIAVFKSTQIRMLDDILSDELTHFLQQTETDQVPRLFYRSRTKSIYAIPLDDLRNRLPYTRNLSQGTHDLTHEDRDYRVLVKHFDNMRYVVKFDDTNIRNLERDFVRLVGLCSIAILIIALFIAWGTSHQIMRPIKQLANQVTASRNDPDKSLNLTEFDNDEIGDLASELQHYQEQLQHLLIREKEFASNVSHELRTQVTSIALATQILSARTGLTPKDHTRIQRIQRAVDEMSELIETFLVLAQISNKSVKYIDAVCDMNAIVQKVIDQQRIWLNDKPVKVIIEEKEPLKVSAQPGILSVLVANLVRNAFRYTERGTITISLTANQLIVTDTGRGIDDATQAQIFKGYVKHSSGNANRIGLGLAIVQRICERYEWTVSFESTQGKGSQFMVCFSS